jgi:hypothetical protein
LSVKGKIVREAALELSTPTQSFDIIAKDLKGTKGQAVEAINPGLEGCSISLEQDPGEFAFLIIPGKGSKQ